MDDVTHGARLRATRRAAARPVIDGRLVRLGERTFGGHAVDPRDPSRKLAIELLVDGFVAAVARADDYDPERAAANAGDDGHAFRFTLDALEPGSVVSARVANLDLAVGEPLLCADTPAEPLASNLPGLVRWLGGLRFAGWVAPRNGEAWASLAVDGEIIAEIRTEGWTRPEPPGDPGEAVPAFDTHLPERFADDRPHRLVARNAAGEELIGSPLAFMAGNPASAPMADYAPWRARHPPDPPPPFDGEIAVILVGAGAEDVTLASLETQLHPDWICAALPAPGPGPAFDAGTALAFLDDDASGARVIVFALAGGVLRDDALLRLADALFSREDAAVVYSDLEVIAPDGGTWPLIFPAFDRERFSEQGYCAHLFALRPDAARHAVAEGADDLYALFHAATDDGAVLAVPGALAILPRFDRTAAASLLAALARDTFPDATVAPATSPFFPAIHLRRRTDADVTVAVLTPAISARTAATLASLRPAIGHNQAGAFVVTAGDDVPAPEGTRLVATGGEATRARLVNAALDAATSGLVCIIDDGMEAEDKDWLAELAARAATADVAAVAPLVVGRDGLVRHAGTVLGPDFAVAPAFADLAGRDPGHAGTLAVAHEVSEIGRAHV